MLRMINTLLCLLLLSACSPSTDDKSKNQFSLKKQKIFFLKRELSSWGDQNVIQCTKCTLSIYNKKSLAGTMLFYQVTKQSGDLVYLLATNIRYGFALQTGGSVYFVYIQKNEEKFMLKVGSEISLLLTLNKTQTLTLGDRHYSFSLQDINEEKQSVELVFWAVDSL